MPLKRFFLFIIYLMLMTALLNSGDSVKIEKPKFAHEIYNVKANPNAEFITLDNGFRIILLPNKLPEKKVNIKLCVDAGIANENEKQVGVAHFLQHMVLMGSKHYSSEFLMEYFEKISTGTYCGGYGYTNITQTMYQIHISDDEKSMNEAISILADFASNLTLDLEAVDKVKEILLIEKKDKENFHARMRLHNLRLIFPNTFFAQPLEYVSEEAVKNITREEINAFYKIWYRPENMVLVVVGNINNEVWKKSIKQDFGVLVSKSNIPKKPIFNIPSHKGVDASYLLEKEAINVRIDLSTINACSQTNNNFNEKKKLQITDEEGAYVLMSRLRIGISKGNSPLLTAKVGANNSLGFEFASISVTSKPENWSASLVLIENEIRKILQFGITDLELDQIKKYQISKLTKAVSANGALVNSQYMQQIIDSLLNNEPFQDANQNYELQKPLIDLIKKEEVLKAFNRCWQSDSRFISIVGNFELTDSEKKIKEIYEAATKIEVKE